MLLRPQYARLQIGIVRGQSEVVKPLASDALSNVPYAEPTWLSEGFQSPFYTQSHRDFQKAMRKFVNEVIRPEMEQCELNGKKISQEVVDKMS